MNKNLLWISITIISILLTIDMIYFMSYQKTKIELEKVKEENKTLQIALAKPAIEQKPKLEIKTETRFIDLSEEQKKKLEEQYGKQINELIQQINAMKSIITTWSYDGGSLSIPLIPQVNTNIPGMTIIPTKPKHTLSVGLMYMYPNDMGFIGMWSPPLQYPLSIIGMYTISHNFGLGLMYTFK